MLGRALRKILWTAGLALALSGMTAGIAQAQTLRMWTFLDPNGVEGREVVLKQLIDTFQAEHPGVTVQVEPQVWQQMNDKFLAAHQTGTAPDLIFVSINRLADAIGIGALADLNELIFNDWTPEEIADIDDPYFNYKAEDGRYFFAVSRAQFGICYRKDLLSAAGIDANELKNFKQFIAAAKQLQEVDANGVVTRWGFSQGFGTAGATQIIGLSILMDEQGNVFNEDGTANWATPAGVKALDLYVDMVRGAKITPEQAVSMVADDVYDQFTSGRAVFARCASARVPRLAQALGGFDKVGWMSTPSLDGDDFAPTEIGGWPVAVWSGSQHKELAAEFLELMASKEADALWVKIGLQPPVRPSTVAENAALFEQPEYEYMVAIADGLAHHGWFPPDNAGNGYNQAFYEAVQDVLTNGTPSLEALKKSEDAYNRANRL